MASGITGITVILGILVIAIIIFGIYVIRKPKDLKEPRNKGILVNLMSNYNKGYGFLTIDEMSFNRETHKIDATPTDLDNTMIKEKDFKLEQQTLFFEKNFLIPLNNSRRRKAWLGLPDNIRDLPPGFGSNLFELMIIQYIVDMRSVTSEEQINEIREKRMTEIEEKLAKGGLGNIKQALSEKIELSKIIQGEIETKKKEEK